jgi:hypothetical protein
MMSFMRAVNWRAVCASAHVDAALIHVGDLEFGIEKSLQIGARWRLLFSEARNGIAAGANLAQLRVEHVCMKIDHKRNIGMLARHNGLRLLSD